MGKRGGPQPGSGRPKGRNNKCTTLTLPIPAYEELMDRAQKAGSTVSQYIIDALELPREFASAKTGINIDLKEKNSLKDLINSKETADHMYQLDSSYQMAAEDDSIDWYKVDSKKKEKKND